MSVLYGDARHPDSLTAQDIAAGQRIYVASAEGTLVVFAAGDKLDVLARNDLGEVIFATPAVAEGTLYVRTSGHLWAFGEKK